MDRSFGTLTETELSTKQQKFSIQFELFDDMDRDTNSNTMDEGRNRNNSTILNETIEGLYDLSGYMIEGQPSIETFGDQTYRVDQYQGKHSDEYTVYELVKGGSGKDGDRDGLAQHFKKGVLQLSWRMVGGQRSGALTIYVNGVVERMTSWSSLRNLDVKRNGLKRKGGNGDDLVDDNIYGEVYNKRGIGRVLIERDLSTDVIVYCGGYNELSLRREGYGVCYDHVSGVEKSFGYYVNGALVHLLQEFVLENDLNGNENVEKTSSSTSSSTTKMMMIEYGGNVSDENMKSVLKRHPIYIGGYVKEGELTIQRNDKENGENVERIVKSPYVRHGHGYVVNELSGICDHESDWCKGVESRESVFSLYGGWYDENKIGNGNGNDNTVVSINVSMIDEEARKRREKEERERAIEAERKRKEEEEAKRQAWLSEEIPICGELGLSRCRGIKDLILGSNAYNGSASNGVSFKLADMPNLEVLSVGDNSFQQVRGFVLTNLNSLKSVKVGNECFRIVSTWRKWEDNIGNGLFSITNCPTLSELQIGDHSFVDFKTFTISQVDLLKSVEFGRYNFLFTNCILKGISF